VASIQHAQSPAKETPCYTTMVMGPAQALEIAAHFPVNSHAEARKNYRF
jgi:hypothetical protein